MSIRIFIYDDHEGRRDSLRSLLEMSSGFEVIGEAANCMNVEMEMQKLAPEVVLMDINMPCLDGIEGLKKIKKRFPQVKVLIQTVYDDDAKVFDCIRYGASGYVLKKDSPLQLLQAIREVNEGGAVMNPGIAMKVLDHFRPAASNPLSERETQVLELLAEGMSYKLIAGTLGLSFFTVNAHCRRIYAKLHVSSLGEAIAYYYKNFF